MMYLATHLVGTGMNTNVGSPATVDDKLWGSVQLFLDMHESFRG